MSKKTALLLVNPFAGNKRGMRVADLIARSLRPYYDLKIYVSNAPSDVTRIVREFKDDVDAVFVVGGDGTVNEVLQSIVGSNLILGVFPLGSGNATAFEMGILTIKQGLRKIIKGKVKTLDCGKVNDRYFMNITGTGFDTAIAADFHTKQMRGLPGYAHLVVKNYFTYKPLDLTFDDGEKVWNMKTFMVNIANMRQLGNFAFTAPMAKPEDGFLDLCIIKPFPMVSSSDILLRLFSRNLDKSKYYEHKLVKQLTVKGDFTHANIDGESIEVNGQMDISVIPQSVRIFS